MKEYIAEWAYRFGYGYYSGIIPNEVVEARLQAGETGRMPTAPARSG